MGHKLPSLNFLQHVCIFGQCGYLNAYQYKNGTICYEQSSKTLFTLVNVYVDLLVFARIVGTS